MMLTTLFSELDDLRQRGVNHFLIGFSGGLDSTALLHGCVRYRQQYSQLTLQACHVHHGLSDNADAWQAHCKQLCHQLGVTFHSARVQIESKPRQSLEAVAREARYGELAKYLTDSSHALLTGHHQDDQVETLLLSLKRGSGLDGLSGMPAVMPLAKGWLARPMLPLSRAELEAYAEQEQLHWIEDESNQDEGFDRNFIRHQLIPLCQQRWPAFVATAARSMSLVAQDRQLLEEITAQDYEHCQHNNNLSISALTDLTLARRHRVFRHWLRLNHAPLWSHAQQLQAWQSVACAQADGEPQLCWGDWQLRRYRDQLMLFKQLDESAPNDQVWHWPDPVMLATIGQLTMQPSDASDAIRLPLASEVVSVRFGQLKTRVRPADRAGSRSLKKVWQELGVPPWLRNRIPLVFFNDECVAALGYWVSKEFRRQPGESGWQGSITDRLS
ncbi:tRNA lysidine(34) synthetase TilS [Neiella marina]|uniref:tRNA(Ile)-lysidine synthase n=1 Tax=Neiella holothuriorum TaxID=2870530 RepID=A0ABS7EEW6_9GAMM|nr:tRNA lysidine(34) synthetase TilS [Neiella holothuriorum]MBW8190878.1 tRNA lysidine(34) synthetase TilS [Neiella holothuriorum]